MKICRIFCPLAPSCFFWINILVIFSDCPIGETHAIITKPYMHTNKKNKQVQKSFLNFFIRSRVMLHLSSIFVISFLVNILVLRQIWTSVTKRLWVTVSVMHFFLLILNSVNNSFFQATVYKKWWKIINKEMLLTLQTMSFRRVFLYWFRYGSLSSDY